MFTSQTPYHKISAAEGVNILKQGNAVLVDVRKEDEYKKSHVHGSLWIPVDEFPTRHSELPTKSRLLFICSAGIRSNLAAEYAASFGADPKRLYSIKQGVAQWIAAATADQHDKGNQQA